MSLSVAVFLSNIDFQKISLLMKATIHCATFRATLCCDRIAGNQLNAEFSEGGFLSDWFSPTVAVNTKQLHDELRSVLWL